MKFFEQWTKLGQAMVEMPFVAAEKHVRAGPRFAESAIRRTANEAANKNSSKRDGKPTTPGWKWSNSPPTVSMAALK